VLSKPRSWPVSTPGQTLRSRPRSRRKSVPERISSSRGLFLIAFQQDDFLPRVLGVSPPAGFSRESNIRPFSCLLCVGSDGLYEGLGVLAAQTPANFASSRSVWVYIGSAVHDGSFSHPVDLDSMPNWVVQKLTSSSGWPSCDRGDGSESCQHPNGVSGVMALDFSRPEAPEHPDYSGAVSVGVVKSADTSNYTRTCTARSAIGLEGVEALTNRCRSGASDV
jgi:hypothetical protein